MPKPLIPLATIDAIRRTVDEAAMPDSITIIRGTRVSNGRGGSIETTAETTYPCRWVIVKTRVSEDGSTQIVGRGSYQPALPLSADVKSTDRARFSNGLYEIVWTPQPGAYSTSRVIGLEYTGIAPVVSTASYGLLLENGNSLLLENGDHLILEDGVLTASLLTLELDGAMLTEVGERLILEAA